MIYAGIGPRSAPGLVRSQMTSLGKQLEEIGFILSSGDGLGSDQAWAEEVAPEKSRIFLAQTKPSCPHGLVPDFVDGQWEFANKHFGLHRGGLALTTQSAYVQYLFMRNINILLGADLLNQEPVDFVAYWYPEDKPSGWAGGTGHTVSMARGEELLIPCFNIHFQEQCTAMEDLINKLISKD